MNSNHKDIEQAREHAKAIWGANFETLTYFFIRAIIAFWVATAAIFAVPILILFLATR